MKCRHTFTPVAFQEYSDAVNWYLERSSIAADHFVMEVTERINAICEDPFRYRNQYKNFYETSLKKFPFYVIYFVDEKKKLVVIASVYHHKRSVKRKYKKKT